MEWHRTEIASCLQGPVVEHRAYNLAIVHVVAEIQIGFAGVDLNMKVDKCFELSTMIGCLDALEQEDYTPKNRVAQSSHTL